MKAQLKIAPSGELEVEGALDIRAVDALREAVLSRLHSGAGLVIQMRGVTECDLSTLQLLYSARSSARLANQSFKILNPPGCLQEACASAGIDPLVLTNTNAI